MTKINEKVVYEYILPKMFAMVKLSNKVENIRRYVKKPNWYTRKSWTCKEEEMFIEWLTQFLRKKFKISKREALSDALTFNLWFGWKIKGDTDVRL